MYSPMEDTSQQISMLIILYSKGRQTDALHPRKGQPSLNSLHLQQTCQSLKLFLKKAQLNLEPNTHLVK